jgi:rod shape-determining protein MreC
MFDTKKFSINKKNFSAIKFLGATVILILLVLTLNFFQSSIKNIFHFISLPVEKTFCNAGLIASSFLSSVSSFGNLAQENEKLKQENHNLLYQISSLRSSIVQEQTEQGAFATCQDDNFELVMANIIGFDAVEDIVLIDKGSDNGIFEGMPVINQQKVVFGKILKANKNHSQIALLSNKDSVVDVKTQKQTDEQSSASGAVKGLGGLLIYLDLVPVDAELKSGDILITSALDNNFPKDLLVGRVGQIIKDDQKPFQQAKVDTFFSIKNTDYLFVIINHHRP